jgi:3-(3-hydroxy-phenyl)propionate hydroxylase
MVEHAVAVAIAGAGPSGLMLGAELALASVDVVIIERRAGQELESSRAGGLHARTIEVLDQRGVADRFLAEGRPMQVQRFAGIPLDISDFPTRHNYGLALWQRHFQRILADWVNELGVPVAHQREVTGFTQDGSGVDVQLSGGGSVRAAFLVGCDGGQSLVRKTAGIEFAGWEPSVSSLLAEVEMRDEPEWGVRFDKNGTQGLGKLEDGKRVRVVLTQRYSGQTGEPTLDDLSRALTAVWGTDFGVHSPSWIARFTDASRQAVTYRNGRVLLAGDAAHIHYPVGGQGLNVGVQDAVNLGWKLAQVVRGTSSESLLDTYQAERHPIAARVLQNTMAQTVLTQSGERLDALRETLAELLAMDEARKRFAGMISGLDVHYDLGKGHPLLGRRMPDLDIDASTGSSTVYSLLHQARPVVINFGPAGAVDIAGWRDRVRLVDARYGGRWELPVVGRVPAPGAVLVRPDGHVAWVGQRNQSGLSKALGAWFGAAAGPTRLSVAGCGPPGSPSGRRR